MSASTNDPVVEVESRGISGGLIWFLVLVALVFFANVGYYLWRSNQNLIRVSMAEDLRVLSQQIAKNATEAAQGNREAFGFLNDVTTEFETKIRNLDRGNERLGLMAAPEAVQPALEKTKSEWAKVQANAQVINNTRQTVLDLHNVSQDLATTIPQLQYLYRNVMDILLDSNATAQQAAMTMRQSWYAERIIRSIQKVLQGGEDAQIAAENFGHDVDVFGEILNGMLQGDEVLEITQVTDPEAREQLEEIATQYATVKDNVGFIINSVNELFKVHDAADEIFVQTTLLLDLTRALSTAINEYQTYDKIENPINYGGHPLISAALGLLLLLLLVIVFFSLRRAERKRRQEAEERAARQAEQVERNQQAIIRLLDEIDQLSEGDLTVNATVTEDFTGAIADAFNETVEQLRQLVATINDTVLRVSNATDETQSISTELAQASKNQAQEITGASAAINEMAVSIEQVSANAAESTQVAEKSVEIAKKGAEVVQNTIKGMDTIREQIQETSKRIKRLGESSQEIGDIVSLINDIADQTNILALNAAIQASMAGESGRGFAVVADEVQRLAERASNATKQIEALVKTIQTDTNEVVISMESSTAEVVRGARLAQDAGVALEEIDRVSSNLADLIQNISNAARQQAASAGHVSNTMNVIQEITNQTSLGTQNTANSIGKLAELAEELRLSVSGFKLPEKGASTEA